MKSYCSHTQGVVSVESAGEVPEALQKHLCACAICRDALTVEAFLKGAQEGLPQLDRLPDPSAIWWRSRPMAQQSRIARAIKPIRILERVAFAAGTTALALGLARNWPAVSATSMGWISTLTAGAHSVAGASATSYLFLVSSAILAMITAAFYAQWAEE